MDINRNILCLHISQESKKFILHYSPDVNCKVSSCTADIPQNAATCVSKNILLHRSVFMMKLSLSRSQSNGEQGIVWRFLD